ncbi:MAG: flagellar export chaperone FliS [Desulfatiglandales bacterium]
MSYGRALGKYDRIRVETAGKMDLVVLCYEKTIQFLDKARTYYQEEKFDQKQDMLNRALGIISELNAALDYDKGGKIAENLETIYNYVTRRLIQGDLQRDLTAFDESMRLMKDLKGAWVSIATGSPINTESEQPYEPARQISLQMSA